MTYNFCFRKMKQYAYVYDSDRDQSTMRKARSIRRIAVVHEQNTKKQYV